MSLYTNIIGSNTARILIGSALGIVALGYLGARTLQQTVGFARNYFSSFNEINHDTPTARRSNPPQNLSSISLGPEKKEDVHPDHVINKRLADTKIMLAIGEPKVTGMVQKILLSENVLVLNAGDTGNTLSWNRDHQVELLNGNSLIPRRANSSWWPFDCFTRIVQTLFVDKQNIGYGEGLSERLHTHSSTRTIDANTCIEGGNVKYFRHAGRIGALVGASSVIHTARYMESNGLFPDQICQAQPETVRQMIYDFILEKIAQDLRIEKKNLLVMEHLYLHIDLELLLGSDGEIFLYDPQQAKQSLEYVRMRSNATKDSRSTNFRAYEIADEFQAITRYAESGVFERNKKKLEEFGFRVFGVPGFFNLNRNETGAQFLNGLFLEDPYNGKRFLLSNSATCGPILGSDESCYRLSSSYAHFLAESFSDRMQELGVSVIYINCQGVMGGGLHCLTRERRLDWTSASPQTIPIHSESLPACITTQLKVHRMGGQAISLIAANREQPLQFDSGDNCDVILPVPLEGRLTFTLLVNGQPLDNQRSYLLPGHPQLAEV